MNDNTDHSSAIAAKIDRALCQFEARGIKPNGGEAAAAVKPLLTPAERDFLIDHALDDLEHRVGNSDPGAFMKQALMIDEECPRCGAGMQATHHWLCEAKDGTPSGLSDDLVRKLIASHCEWQRAHASRVDADDDGFPF